MDLRQLNISIKAIQNYTPATEIDASIHSHPPLPWKVAVVDIPKPDYTGLKLNAQDAHVTGDPRLRKIFRLSTDEKDSPASPKASPRANSSTARVDPRRRKVEEAKTDPNVLSYAQQLTLLQTSAFYQSLTSNQKLTLNQELSQRADQSGNSDPTLLSMLAKLGLLPNAPNSAASASSGAVNILSSLNNMNPGLTPNLLAQNPALLNQPNVLQQNNLNPNLIGNPIAPNILNQNPNLLNQITQNVGQPGLLGAAPGIPNLPPNFEINFNPRNGGLLGNAPFPNYPDNNTNFNNYNEDFYESGNNFRGNNRNERGFNDNRNRRGRNFNRNNGNRNFRNRNRSNRGHTPP